MLENKTFVIEPASGHNSEAHFIYRVENLRLTQGDCGHGFNMTSVPLGNHIKNPFQSFHTRVRTAVSGKLDFIALLLAVEMEFQCCIGVRSWFGVVFISVVNKKTGVWPNTIKLASLPGWILSQRVLPWTWHILSALRAQSGGPTQGWPLVYIKQVQHPSATIPLRLNVHLCQEVKLKKKKMQPWVVFKLHTGSIAMGHLRRLPATL